MKIIMEHELPYMDTNKTLLKRRLTRIKDILGERLSKYDDFRKKVLLEEFINDEIDKVELLKGEVNKMIAMNPGSYYALKSMELGLTVGGIYVSLGDFRYFGLALLIVGVTSLIADNTTTKTEKDKQIKVLDDYIKEINKLNIVETNQRYEFDDINVGLPIIIKKSDLKITVSDVNSINNKK